MTIAIAGWILLGVVIGFAGGFFIGYVVFSPKFDR